MNATTHPVAPEEIMAFVDGELSADRAQFVSSHVGQCEECRKVEDSLRNTSLSLAGWTVTSVPSALENQVIPASAKTRAQLDAVASSRLPRSRRWTRKRWLLALATAGCAFLLLLAISIPNLYRTKMAANEDSPIARQRVAETEKAMSDAIAAQPSAAEGGKTGRGAADAMDSGYFVHRIPFQAQASDATKLLSLPSGPMIARTVSLSIVLKDFDAGRASLDAILARHNGYAASLNVSTPQEAARTLQASLRIPAQQLVSALAELKALGRVEAETQNGEEVTQQHADLAARLKNSRETEQRLQDVLRTRTGKVKDVLEVEEEIARVRGEIEQMEAEQKTLEHRVDFTTIDVKLTEEYKAQLSNPAPSVTFQLRNATVNGFRNAFESLLGMVLFLAESGPTLLLWLSIIAVPAWMLWRRYRRAQSVGSLAGV
jgi:hypothetical protein